MINSKGINIVVAAAMILALVIVSGLFFLGNTAKTEGASGSEPAYAQQVFGAEIISVDILVSGEDWQEMLNNALSEQFIMADVVVNGTKFQNVGIRPKGNSSLTQVAQSNSDRYSFRLQFDEYISGQTCFGLQSFVLNNMLGDYSYMKEYVSYDLMREIGVDAPYFGYADIRVNGESWGLYLAVEMYNDSYEQRIFGNTSGMLYNVKSMDIGGNAGNGGAAGSEDGLLGFFGGEGFGQRPQSDQSGQPDGTDAAETPAGGADVRPDGENFGQRPQRGQNSQDGADAAGSPPSPADIQLGDDAQPEGGAQNGAPPSLPGADGGNGEAAQADDAQSDSNAPAFPGFDGGRGGFAGEGDGFNAGRGGSGGSLAYIDDDSSSYSAIFGNVVGKGKESDYQRVIEALKALSEGRDLEKYFDVDKILRYFAAHTIVVNLDSYSSGMAQNYYICEMDGQITILPWDYNLAWGGFQSGGAESVINFPIDTPVSGVELASRPLLEKLLANEEYLDRYHGYLQELIDNYFADGKFEAKISELDALIGAYVQNDATAFCSYEEYREAVSAFATLGNLRGQSVLGQLDGSVPSTSSEQSANPDKLISADGLDLSALGSSMNGGNNQNGAAFFQGDQGNAADGSGTMFDRQLMQQAMRILQESNGELTEAVKESLYQLGLSDEQIGQLSSMGGRETAGNTQNARYGAGSPGGDPAQTSGGGGFLLLTAALFACLILATLLIARKKRTY